MVSGKKSFVFFGSGPVAAESLRLLREKFIIEAVVTKTTTMAEMSSIVPDVKVYVADNKQMLDELFTTTSFRSSVALLIDFGVILSNKVISYFPNGIINSHFSLLPELRGADPISFAILEGKKQTGVSLMLLVEAMDEGPLLVVGMFDLDGTETGPSLTKELIQLSYRLLLENFSRYLDGTITPVTQEVVQQKFNLTVSYARKIKKSDGIIDWSKPAVELEREIRAYLDWPKSRTTLKDVDVIITKSHVVDSENISLQPGEIESLDNTLVIKCGIGSLQIDALKPTGKTEMDAKAFLAGYKNRITG